jgi:hypothetical protein
MFGFLRSSFRWGFTSLVLLGSGAAHALDGSSGSLSSGGLLGSSSVLSPVYAALSIHVEGASECPQLKDTGGVAPTASQCDEARYERHVKNMQEMAALFVNSSASLPLSLEFEEEFLNAAKAFRENIPATGKSRQRLNQLVAEGHSLGSHADSYAYAGEPAGKRSYSGALGHFRHLKEVLEHADVQSAVSSINSVSGVCTAVDWAKAIQSLGYDTVAGIVSYCLKSLPSGTYASEDIPGGASSIDTACPSPSACHATYPYVSYSSTTSTFDLKDAVRPWRSDSALKYRAAGSLVSPTNWQASVSTGRLAMLGGVGSLYCLAEKKTATSRTSSETGCDFCQDDIETYFQMLDEALASRRMGERLAFLSVYSLGSAMSTTVGRGCSDGTPSGKTRGDLIKDFVSRMSRYVSDGKVVWTTVPKLGPLVR